MKPSPTSTKARRPRQPPTFVEARVDELADVDAVWLRVLDLALEGEEGRALLATARRKASR